VDYNTLGKSSDLNSRLPAIIQSLASLSLEDKLRRIEMSTERIALLIVGLLFQFIGVVSMFYGTAILFALWKGVK
jgi:hypothetical protein